MRYLMRFVNCSRIKLQRNACTILMLYLIVSLYEALNAVLSEDSYDVVPLYFVFLNTTRILLLGFMSFLALISIIDDDKDRVLEWCTWVLRGNILVYMFGGILFLFVKQTNLSFFLFFIYIFKIFIYWSSTSVVYSFHLIMRDVSGLIENTSQQNAEL